MELSEWMSNEGLTDERLADRIGCARSTVTRLRLRSLRPSSRLVRSVVLESKGLVSANELLGLELRERVPSEKVAHRDVAT